MKRKLLISMLLGASLMAGSVNAAEYVIDTKKAHAFIQFKIKHLGYSWLIGRFNTFEGEFSYDEKNPSAAKIEVRIDPASIDSNHAERDKHLRGKDFLHVSKYDKSKFVSKSFMENKDGTATLTGDFTLHGVTKELKINVKHIGHGNDPWGGYRRGFEGKTSFALKDFGMNYNLGPASKEVELFLSVEGIRKK